MPLAVALLALSAVADRAAALDEVVFAGRGYGHGAGMSQWGAYGMARRGAGHVAILRHFYRGAVLRTSPRAAGSIRVLLADGRSSVPLVAGAGHVLLGADGRRVPLAYGRVHTITPAGPGRLRVRLSGPGVVVEAPARVVVDAAAARREPVRFAGRPYRGVLSIERSGAGIRVLNRVAVEEYLRGVVAAEVPASWPAETLNAQAIAARTVAVRSLNGTAAFDVYADVRSQAYLGVAAEHGATSAAVAATRGQILEYGGEPILALYHSSSGGRTAAAEDALEGLGPYPYLRSVPDPGDVFSPLHRWTERRPARRVAAALGFRGSLSSLLVSVHGGRVREVEAVGAGATTRVTGPALRFALELPSAAFRVVAIRAGVDRAGRLRGRALSGSGSVRRVVLQRVDASGLWRPAGRLAVRAGGAFSGRVSPRPARIRVIVDGVAGSPIPVPGGRTVSR